MQIQGRESKSYKLYLKSIGSKDNKILETLQSSLLSWQSDFIFLS